jgi:uncharacterized membrane protein YeaQ/YmgE (transglycosylase-associated protein family)
MEFIASIDSVICVLVGAIIGGLAGYIMKGLGMLGNIAVGAAGGLIGGLVFDKMDVIDVGDIADPAIAGHCDGDRRNLPTLATTVITKTAAARCGWNIRSTEK